jgi:FMN reductase
MAASIVGFAGSASRPSRTRSLVEGIVEALARRLPVTASIFDLGDVQPGLGTTLDPREAPAELAELLAAIRDADALVVGSPIYKGTYAGLFKHLFDLVEPKALKGKPVVLAATGGSQLHALALDHGLRPLFAFFSADVVATAIYATEAEFADSRAANSTLIARIERAADELAWRLGEPRQLAAAPLARIA